MFQTFATTGARGAKLFEADGTAWLAGDPRAVREWYLVSKRYWCAHRDQHTAPLQAIANYGDSKSYDFRQKSTLWRRDTSGESLTACCRATGILPFYWASKPKV